MDRINQNRPGVVLTKKKVQSKTYLASIFLAAILSVCLAAPPFACSDEPRANKTAKPSRGNWDSFWYGEKIIRKGLEKLGYTVNDPKTLNNAARFLAVAQGEEVDYTTDVVLPGNKVHYEKTKDRVALLGPILQPGSIEGYMIDKKTSEKYGITMLTDMKKPKIAKLFDSDGDGKAEMVGCSPGWGCEKLNIHHMDAYNLHDTVKFIQGDYNALIANIVARYMQGEPVFLWAWYPNAATVQMVPGRDLVLLQVPFVSHPEGYEGDTILYNFEGCAGGTGDCNVGCIAANYYIAANKKWLAENPVAKKFFDLIKMDIADRAKQNAAMMLNGEDSEKDIERHANEWIASHQAEFESWIAEARKAAQ